MAVLFSEVLEFFLKGLRKKFASITLIKGVLRGPTESKRFLRVLMRVSMILGVLVPMYIYAGMSLSSTSNFFVKPDWSSSLADFYAKSVFVFAWIENIFWGTYSSLLCSRYDWDIFSHSFLWLTQKIVYQSSSLTYEKNLAYTTESKFSNPQPEFERKITWCFLPSILKKCI